MAAPLPPAVAAQESEALGVPLTLQARMEDCWDEPEPATPPAASDLEELQGVSAAVAGRREAQLLIASSRFAVRFHDGDVYMGAFELDGAALPRVMAMRIDEGPAHHKGQTALCIYELAGDSLHWCAAGPGRSERLSAFPAADDAHYLYLVFRRERPA